MGNITIQPLHHMHRQPHELSLIDNRHALAESLYYFQHMRREEDSRAAPHLVRQNILHQPRPDRIEDERVRGDVVRNYVSPARAREDYGVVLTSELAVDAEATARMRAEMTLA